MYFNFMWQGLLSTKYEIHPSFTLINLVGNRIFPIFTKTGLRKQFIYGENGNYSSLIAFRLDEETIFEYNHLKG
ncbi:hypothetical protein CYL18_17630 [Pradoshia eiseniae]|uniref:Uncharacterized protein n=1 Tax=Pradoshia eiseniae TaxID=2064768 RepID=A0A2S7MVP2_9BACI|nr:hypothetical protein CYL18_17630 [Pradoshia eiseniae]